MKCVYCSEDILSGERAAVMGSDLHRECAVRSIAGSVGHQLHECHCYRGHYEDPPGMTQRQAAQAAQRLFDHLQEFRALFRQ